MLRVISNHAKAANFEEFEEDFKNLNYSPIVIDNNLLIKEGYKQLSDCLKVIWKKP